MKILRQIIFITLIVLSPSVILAGQSHEERLQLAQKGSYKGSHSHGHPRTHKFKEKKRLSIFGDENSKNKKKKSKPQKAIKHNSESKKYFHNTNVENRPGYKPKLQQQDAEGRAARKARLELIKEKRKKWMDAQKAGDENWEKYKEEYKALRYSTEDKKFLTQPESTKKEQLEK